MRKLLLPFLIFALGACSQNNGSIDTRPIQMPATPPFAETVNGTAVPMSLLDAFAQTRHLDMNKPEQRDRALKGLTDFVLMAQEAQRQNLYSARKFQAQVEVARLQGVADATFAQFTQLTPISDTILKAEYDSEVARTGKRTYDFSQLLFANQDDAIKAEGEILSGESFAKVFDAWQDKAKQAKSFTRVRLDQVPEELGKVLASLSNGETTKVPVKTEFGWHVVHLDISNPFTPPPFDQVKAGIRRDMQVKIGQQRLAKLREQAKVEYPVGAAPVSSDSPEKAPAKSSPEAVTPPSEKKG
ncbi:MAG TPA: peptidylprolyl isomerase [Rudaea sp.]|nr:peptidylprolyl isomerase [Rudaea sp.]